MSKKVFKKLFALSALTLILMGSSVTALAYTESGPIRVNFPGRGGWSAPTIEIKKTDNGAAFVQNIKTPVKFKTYCMAYSKKHAMRVSKSTYGMDSAPSYKTWMPYLGKFKGENISAKVGSAWWDLNSGHVYINFAP